MIPYAIKCDDLTVGHLAVFRAVVNIVNKMPEKPEDGPGLSCHDVCDEVLKFEDMARNLCHMRGRFGEPGDVGRGAFEHSWLEFTQGKRVIIDVYPVAVGSGPILLFADERTPWYWLYVPDCDEVEMLKVLGEYGSLYGQGKVAQCEALLEKHKGNIRLLRMAMDRRQRIRLLRQLPS
jgi:hypothetical protein